MTTNQINRVAIVGGPNTGKTTLAERLSSETDIFKGLPIIHTDDWCDLPWKEQAPAINAGLARVPRFILEGVQACRCLRGAKDGSWSPLDVDLVLYLSNPAFKELTSRQRGLTKTVEKIFKDWLGSSQSDGVECYDISECLNSFADWKGKVLK